MNIDPTIAIVLIGVLVIALVLLRNVMLFVAAIVAIVFLSYWLLGNVGAFTAAVAGVIAYLKQKGYLK